MKEPHPLLPNRDERTIEKMLKATGAASVSELFSDIPERFALGRRLDLPAGMDEANVRKMVARRLSVDRTPPDSLCFLGGGVWPHYVPAAVDAVISRQEFYTSYTPYQPEMSQGMLQALFEYQSLMGDLLGMEACNSSMYDWASAAGEAARESARITGRKKLLVAGNVGPQRLEVIRTYTEPLDLEIRKVAFDRRTGEVDLGSLDSELGADVAGLYLENPNHFGVIEERVGEAFDRVHRAGGLAIAGVEPLSLSAVREPGSYGADIAVGEGQPLGIAMNYGGPHIGIFGVKDLPLARSMPGRLIGVTTEKGSERKAFCMVLQAREQHIRREAATSNICTNQALMAVAAACYTSLLGKNGLRRLGEVILANSHYAAERLSRIEGLTSPLFSGPYFKEFTVGYEGISASDVFEALSKRDIFAGYPLTGFGIGEAGSFCVTEVHGSDEIERLAQALEALM